MRGLRGVLQAGVCGLVALGLAACGSSNGGGATGGSDSGLEDGTTSDGQGGGDSATGDSATGDSALTDSGGGPTDSGTKQDSSTPGDSGTPKDSGTTGDSSTTDSGSPPPVGDSVLMHHKNPSRDGMYVQPAFTKAAISTLHQDTTFSVSLPDPNDQVYAQPLFVDGGGVGPDLVIVATEANNIYALNAATGAQVWVKNLGTPVPLGSMSCGNINPFGVTGTPVIDWASRTLFADALVLATGNKPQHEVFALSIDTGNVQTGWPVVVNTVATAGSTTFGDKQIGERGALAIVGDTVYVPYGGLFGDCNPYNGWILAITMANPTQTKAWATTLRGGGIWSPAGLSTDGTKIYAATGNTFGGSGKPWGGGDGVVAFGVGSAFGTLSDYYAPTEWLTLDNGDLDMGPTPVVFDLAGSTPSHLAITFGKDGDAYLLDRTNLGGVGNALSPTAGQSYTLNVATNQIISAPVVYTTAMATYAVFKGNGSKCTNGTSGSLTSVKVLAGSPPALVPSWCAGSGSGSPIVTTSNGQADAIVWDIGAEGSNHLEAYDADSGATLSFTGSTVSIPNMRRYNAPIAAKGRIFVPADNTVVAFTL